MSMPRLDAPILLVHGLFGFDQIAVGGMALANYFPGIVEALQAAGNRIYIPGLSPTSSIVCRAEQLQTFLRTKCPYEQVHLFAHSMGGLDCRYLISKLGRAEQVLTLTTLGTPHRGTSFAEWAIGKVEWIVKPVLQTIGMPHDAFYDLTPKRCAEFNAAVPDAAGVRYFSVAAEHDGRYAPEWFLSHRIVSGREGPNDGVVSLASAEYGEEHEVWPGDHFTLVHWSTGRYPEHDVLPRWEGLLHRLKRLGY